MTYQFDPSKRLILVDALLTGPDGRMGIQLALDTGVSRTQLIPSVLENVGYHLDHAINRIKLNTAGGTVERFKLNIIELKSLGRSTFNPTTVVGELPPKSGIHSLLGLDHFQNMDLRIDFLRGVIRLRKPSFWNW